MANTDLDLAPRTIHPQQVLERELETERGRHLMGLLTTGAPDSVARRGELASVLFAALLDADYLVVPRPRDGESPDEAVRVAAAAHESRETWEPNFVDMAAVLIASGMMQPASPENVPRVAYERALELDSHRRRRMVER